MNFGEKVKEYSAKHGRDLEVWQSPKYTESKAKAEEIINSGKYGIQPSDFWILMNATKTDKMAYTGLIISHNGCLKINDELESKFCPECVTEDKEGYGGSLVYKYCNKEQGIFEVGEVSSANCKNDYPYAMAYKRLFDRVVLKLSKLAYAGIYSDSEADEFVSRLNVVEQPTPEAGYFVCEECGAPIMPYKNDKGEEVGLRRHSMASVKKFGKTLCLDCIEKRKANE